MFKFCFASFISCFLVMNSFAQKQNVYFLKDNGRYVSTKDSADFVRIIREPDSGSVLYNVLDYYPNNNIKLVAKSSAIEPVILEGMAMSYYPNKRKKQIANYAKGSLSGICYDYYPNGKLYRSVKFEAHAPVGGYNFSPRTMLNLITWENIDQVYDSLGVVTVTSGDGYYHIYNPEFTRIAEEGKVKNGKRDSIWTGFDADGKVMYKEEFAGGNFLKGYQKGINGDTINYTIKEALPTFKGGDAEFAKFLAQTIRYPRYAMENNVQGQLIVSFVVNSDGNLSDIKILKSIDRTLDAEAISVLKRSPKWSPAIQNGLPIKANFTMPVSFSLSREVHGY